MKIIAGTEPLNKEVVSHTEKPQGARGGGQDGLNKKSMTIIRCPCCWLNDISSKEINYASSAV